MNRPAQGFTLIELIVVIIVIGILAAVALPRFLNLQIQARQASLSAAVGAIRAGAALAHAGCLGQTTPAVCASSGASSVTMEGVAIATFHGYPQALSATTDGILAASGINTAGVTDYTISGGGAGAGDTVTIDVPGVGSGTCRVTYTAPAAANTQPTVTVVANTCS